MVRKMFLRLIKIWEKRMAGTKRERERKLLAKFKQASWEELELLIRVEIEPF